MKTNECPTDLALRFDQFTRKWGKNTKFLSTLLNRHINYYESMTISSALNEDEL